MDDIKSLLFIPANKLHYLHNKNDADGLIIDFEDSVISENIMDLVSDFNNNDISHIKKKIIIRIDTLFFMQILENIDNTNLFAIMVPKAIYSDEIITIVSEIKKRGLEVILLIETPKAFLHLEKLILLSKPIALCFGSEDYCASMKCQRTVSALSFARQYILNIGRAFDLFCYDTIYPYLTTDQSFHEEVDHVRELGFDGKLAIHPKQIDYINNTFSNYDLTSREMEEIINKFNNNGNIIVYNNKMYERPHIEFLIKKLKEVKNKHE